MKTKEISLAWIVVEDLKKAIAFYTEVAGLKLEELNEAFGWAELSGHAGGARLGLAQKNDKDSIQPGQNAILTLTIENLDTSIQELRDQNVQIIGEVMEVPGVVKMQLVADPDGNQFQLVELLSSTTHSV